jgi:hypothetical protein
MPWCGRCELEKPTEARRFVDRLPRRHYVAPPFSRDAALP